MEIMEGLDSNYSSTHNNVAKGKRTKRMRLLSPCGVVAAAVTTTVVTSSTSSANSGASSTTTYESEEEDMANCLILLAQGDKQQQVEDHDGVRTEKSNNNSNNNTSTAAATTAVNNNTKVGFYIYECKTCNRTFPSFQALGGHRASHKKPKLVSEEKKQPSMPPPTPQSQLMQHMIITNYDRFVKGNVKSGPPPPPPPPQISLQLGHGNNKGKIHECSICGSEFTSGQALGGHMRRHRASTNTNNTICNTVTATAPPRNILQLDLNLPAPEDDLREAKFQFTATQVLVGTPALVDCHY